MSLQVAYWLILIGALLVGTGGCAHPLGAAVATTNTAARSLTVTHGGLAQRYRAEQEDAARRVQGDRSDPSVRAEQRDRVEVVRRKWAPAWSAYGLARASWAALASWLKVALDLVDAGGIVNPLEALPLVQQLVQRQRELIEAAEELVPMLAGAPPRGAP